MLESDASTAAQGFSEIVLWAWEDEPLSEPHSREKTFMTALDCDQAPSSCKVSQTHTHTHIYIFYSFAYRCVM